MSHYQKLSTDYLNNIRHIKSGNNIAVENNLIMLKISKCSITILFFKMSFFGSGGFWHLVKTN